MMKRKFTRLICLVLASLILVGGGSIATGAATTNNTSAVTDKSIMDYVDALNMISYEEYMNEYAAYFNNYQEINNGLVPLAFDTCQNWTYENERGNQVYVVTIKDGKWNLTVYDLVERISDKTGLPEVVRVPSGEEYDNITDAVEEGGFVKADLPYVAEFGGRNALYLPEIGTVTWDIPLSAAGLYNVSFSYFPVYDPEVSKSASIERKFFVNGEAAFAESHALTLHKIWSSFKADKTSSLTATYKLDKKDDINKIIADAEWAGLTYTVAEDRKSITVVRPTVITQSIYEFVDKYGMRFFITDANDNELRPTMVQTPEWTEFAVRDSGGFYSSDFGFVLEPKDGKVTLSLEGSNELMAISSINLKPYEKTQTYGDYLNFLQANGVDTGIDGTDKIKLEAENMIHTSTNGVYPLEDRTSALTSPCDTSRVLLNTIGTEKWSTAGQWVEYNFTVGSSGMYEMYSRYKQSYLDGMFVSRALRIYTECDTLEQYVAKYGTAAGYYEGVPFEEASQLRYDYGSGWQVTNMTNGNGTYKIYFHSGVTYTIRLEVTLGSMSPRVQQIQNILDTLNRAYLNIIKLTGTSPDDYRDYGFTRLLPDTLMEMLDMAKELDDLSAFLKTSAGVSSTYSGTCDRLSNLIRKMVFDEDELAKNLDNFKSYVGNLGTFLTDAKTQPLQLDFLMIQSSDAEEPKGAANFWQTLWHEICSFFQSFLRDYNTMGAMNDADGTTTTIDVWLAYGRDQSQVIRNLTTNKFTPDEQIAVNLKLISAGTLLPSILAGMGPDVYLGLADETVINYAIRGALTNVETMEGFDQIVESSFTHAAMLQLKIADADGVEHTYGLPETQTFQMMFVRTDILGELGIEIPKTWDDIYTAQSILESNNMEIGVNNNYKIFLYQNNGDLYADDGMRINLDSTKGLAAFEQMCNLFTQYSFPYSYNAANRFRTGEMPIILSDYTTLYNQLKVFATEIDGRWAFFPVPGTVQEDGSINNTADSTIAAVVMISGQDATSQDASWKFMKWYTGEECQTEYANEMVAIIGDSAKHPTANRNALKSMPWSRDEYAEVARQFENLAAIPNYPGSYYIGRHTSFAFLAAYNDDADPTTELLSYINTINKEITRKREEFNLETLEIGQTLASKRMDQAMTAIDALIALVGSNSRYAHAIETARYAIANEKISLLHDASLALSEMLEYNYVAELNRIANDDTISDVVKESATKAVIANASQYSFFKNVGKQTAETKNGGYNIEDLNEMQLVYFISECLRNAASALQSYK